MQTIICMKWGKRYGADYVNRLARAIARNTRRPTRLICFTDDRTGIDEAVICHELPSITLPDELSWTPWRKLAIWQYPLIDLAGDVLFLDLDLVIIGDLDRLFDYHPGSYCVIDNWTQKGQGIGNTSCFRFPVERYRQIFDHFEAQQKSVLDEYRIEQQYISALIPEQKFWPDDWCVSFKHSLLPAWPLRLWQAAPQPDDASIVAFTGKPDPDDAIIGRWPLEGKGWYKGFYKRLRPVKWVAKAWQ